MPSTCPTCGARCETESYSEELFSLREAATLAKCSVSWLAELTFKPRDASGRYTLREVVHVIGFRRVSASGIGPRKLAAIAAGLAGPLASLYDGLWFVSAETKRAAALFGVGDIWPPSAEVVAFAALERKLRDMLAEPGARGRLGRAAMEQGTVETEPWSRQRSDAPG